MFKVSIVVVSDTCAKDHSADLTAGKVGSVFSSYDAFNNPRIFEIGPTVLVPDHKYSIQKDVLQLTEGDSPSRLILTCGGTGFTTKDITPEAISPLIERPAPGIVHAMLSKSLSITSFAMMSRPVAGTIKNSLVITLPGSPKGASENLSAVIHTLKHALAQMDQQNSRALHDKMKRITEDQLPGENSTSFCHQHASPSGASVGCGLAKHKLLSNDLSQGVTQRKRESLYPMIEVSAALSEILTNTQRNADMKLSIVDKYLVGSTIAEDIVAPTNVPNFRASIVDGYAVHHTDGPGVYPVVAVSHASASELTILKPGTIARVTTGAPVPQGATAVVMVEETVLKTSTLDSKEEKEVEILAMDVKENDNIRKIGSDVEYNSRLLNKGHIISPNGGEVGLLGSVGVNEVPVVKKPKIGILSTGSELVDVVESSSPLKYGQVFDTNRLTLNNICSNLNYNTIGLGAVVDDPLKLVQKLKDALNSDIDYLITTGGVSMGELDLLKPVIERDLGGTIHFGRVNMKPGKPTTFATVTVESTTKYIFALPGNPASAAVCFYVFVLPSLLKFGGSTNPSLPKIKARLSTEIKLDTRYEYQRARIYQDKDDFLLKAEPTGFQRSSRVGSFNNSNGLLVLPSKKDHGDTLAAGSLVECLSYGPITL